MSAPANCPVCGTKLLSDWESCPNCPMTFRDAPAERSALQSEGFRNFGIPLLFFGGLAFGIWTFSQYMWRTAEQGANSAAEALKPAPGVKDGGAAPLDFSAPAARDSEAEAPGLVSIMAERRPPPQAVAEWRMRGAVYDLITLQPVPGVHMIFTDNVTNSRAQIKTDPEGRYRAVLPALEGRGYLVSLSKTGYFKSYLDPGTEGVADMPLERRSEIVRELSSLIAEPASLQPNADTPLVTDFHMAPR